MSGPLGPHSLNLHFLPAHYDCVDHFEFGEAWREERAGARRPVSDMIVAMDRGPRGVCSAVH